MAKADHTPWSVQTFPAQLLDHSTDGLLAFDRNGRVVYANATFRGLAADDALVGKQAADVLASLFGRDLCDDLFQGLLAGLPPPGMTRVVTQDPAGAAKVCEIRFRTLRDAGSVVRGGCISVHDVSQHVASEALVRESEARFRIMADNSPVLLWMAGIDARCTFFNQRWLEFTGRSQTEEFGYGWAEGVHPADFQRCVDTYMAAFSKREEFSMEYRLRRHDGVFRWFLDNGRPRYLADGTFAGYIGSCIDISDRKEVEEARERVLASERVAHVEAQRLYEEAEAASRLKDEFLATISHELRTPLNAMAGWSALLVNDLIEPEGQHEAYEAIDRNARAQTKLIDDLLDVSRIVTGQLRLDVHPVELHAVLRDALDAVSLSAQAKKIDIRITADPSLGPVEGDPLRLTQVIWNLLANAIKFTPERGHIAIRLERHIGKAVLTVSDTGLGIGSDFLPFVFERFRQADGKISRRFGGLGLGLAIVKHLVELHGGTVDAKSGGIGQGSTFRVTLPLMAVRVGKPLGESDEPATSASTSRPPPPQLREVTRGRRGDESSS